MNSDKKQYFDLTVSGNNIFSLFIKEKDVFTCDLKDKEKIYDGFILAKTPKGKNLTICDIDFQKSNTDSKYQARLVFRKTDENLEDKKSKSNDTHIRIPFSRGQEGYRNFWQMIAFLYKWRETIDLGDFKDIFAVTKENLVGIFPEIAKLENKELILENLSKLSKSDLMNIDNLINATNVKNMISKMIENKENSISLQQQNVKLNIQYYKEQKNKNKEINLQENTFKPSYTYTDQEFDSESGLMYYDARYYDTDLKGFISQDPALMNINKSHLVNPQKLNSYSYVLNNPLKYIDPTGNTETWALFNPLTYPIVGATDFFAGLVYGRDSEQFKLLSHSFEWHPKDVYHGNDSELSKQIIKSQRYKHRMHELISENSGKNNFIDVFHAKYNRDKLYQNDKYEKTIGLTLGKIDLDIAGNHIDNNTWELTISGKDRYDFDVFRISFDNFKSDMANNAGLILQSLGIISNYNNNINFRNKIKQRKTINKKIRK